MQAAVMQYTTSRQEKFIIVAACLIIAYNLASILLIAHETHWYGPVQDFWGSIPFIENALVKGEWYGADLWIAQNNHRLVLPRLAFLVDYQYFNGSNYFLAGLGIGLITAEILLISWVVNTAPIRLPSRICITLAVIAVLSMPVVVYNLIHTFNSQWIQCAMLALLSCILCALGLEEKKMYIFIAGLSMAILCHFTTFTLTAIWPALFYLLYIYRAPKKYWITIVTTSVIFGYCFLFILPIEDIPGGRYDITALASSMSLSQLTDYLAAISVYVINYFSMPFTSVGEIPSQLLTVISILWLITSLAIPSLMATNYPKKVLIAVMLFCFCLAITTAIGRAYMGDVGSGPRFGPVILLYWSASTAHLLLFLYDRFGYHCANYVLASIVIITGVASINQSISTGKRLAEDHNRFVMPQMAQLVGNFEKNALYENLVVEWRETSYPGIVRALPYLRDNHKGIFASDIAQLVKKPAFTEPYKTCGHVKITQKSRSNDPLIRQISISNLTDFTGSHDLHMIIYEDSLPIAVLFQKRNNPIKQIISKNEPTWIGISSKPINISTMTLMAWDEAHKPCQLIPLEK